MAALIFALTSVLIIVLIWSGYVVSSAARRRMDELSRKLATRATHDTLTGVANRKAFDIEFQRSIQRARDTKEPLSLLMCDIDHFKKFNDTHGHDVGDQVLKMVAARIARVRGGGNAYRFGGEEFVIVFPGTALARAFSHLEALRLDIANHGLMLRTAERPAQSPARANARPRKPRAASAPAGGKKLSVTISIGAAERNEKLDAPADVLTAADKALYRAKRAGRNRVCS